MASRRLNLTVHDLPWSVIKELPDPSEGAYQVVVAVHGIPVFVGTLTSVSGASKGPNAGAGLNLTAEQSEYKDLPEVIHKS